MALNMDELSLMAFASEAILTRKRACTNQPLLLISAFIFIKTPLHMPVLKAFSSNCRIFLCVCMQLNYKKYRPLNIRYATPIL